MSNTIDAMQTRINFLVDQHADLFRAYQSLAAQRDDLAKAYDKEVILREQAEASIKREQDMFSSLAKEKREVVQALNAQLAAAAQDIELLKAAGRKMEEQLAEARKWQITPPFNAAVAPMMPDTYRVDLAAGLMATQVRQNDCVVIVIRRKGHALQAGPFPPAVISEVGHD